VRALKSVDLPALGRPTMPTLMCRRPTDRSRLGERGRA
jgi:hypothetical protein